MLAPFDFCYFWLPTVLPCSAFAFRVAVEAA
jgi:hypothetical protein